MSPDPDASVLACATADLRRGAEVWAATPYADRLQRLQQCLRRVARASGDWVAVCCARKHADLAPAAAARAAGEEIAAGPLATARHLRLLIATHRELVAGRLPALPGRVRGGAVPVFPTAEMFDRSLYRGYSAAVRLAAIDVPLQTPPPLRRAEVCVVLGAGNVSSIPLTDLLHQVFQEGRAVLLKPNPVHDELLGCFTTVLAPLIELGVVRIVTGDATLGAAAARHDLVDAVHLTGARRTDAALRASLASRPHKTLTSELGNVSPVLVLPGSFTARDLRIQAENVATMLVNNASSNCVALQVLLTWRAWPQRRAFLDAIDAVLESVPRRRCWYPGSAAQFARFCPALVPDGPLVPWTLQRDVDPGTSPQFLREEIFAGAAAEIALPASDAAGFQVAATRFLNEQVAGSLGATILAPPGVDPGHAVAELRYGTVGVNHWSALGYAWMSPPWGGYPGGDSGTGFVHNTYLLTAPRQTVLRGPFRPLPRPVWFATHRHGSASLSALCRSYTGRGLWQLPAALWHGLRG